MIIPWQDIDPDTLTNLIEHFVLREGTDYGELESSMTDKIKQVHNQLKSGEAVIVYSDSQASIDIKLRRELQ